MKTFYRICAFFSLFVVIVLVTASFVFGLSGTHENRETKETMLQVENYSIYRLEDERSLHFYYQTTEDFSLSLAIALGYEIYDIEQKNFTFIVEDPTSYIHVSIFSSLDSSGYRVLKEK